jgi:hypothetical protein
MPSPWTFPSHAQPGTSEQALDVSTLHDRTRTLTQRIDQYQQRIIATDTGLLIDALTLPDGAVLTTLYPPTDFMAIPSVRDERSVPARMASIGADAARLHAIATTMQWWPLGVGPGSVQRYAYGRFVGYTEAVPLRVHRLGSADSWRCIGGQIQQAQAEGAWVTFSVPTVTIQLKRGLIGILYTLAAGSDPTIAHYITDAKWAALDQGGLGTLPRHQYFAPLLAIASYEPVLTTEITLVVPAMGGNKALRSLPSGPVGLAPE